MAMFSLSQTLSFNNNSNNLRDASFSSYLNNTEEKFIRKRTDQATTTTKDQQLYLGAKSREEDGEIGVFGAEKYFNGVADQSSPTVVSKNHNHKQSKDENIHLVVPELKPRSNIQSGTPSIRSESSWNSQSALIQNVLKNNPSRRKTREKKFLSRLRCSCSDKDSTEINEDVNDSNIGKTSFRSSQGKGIIIDNKAAELLSIKDQDLVLSKENCFSFASMSSNLPIKVHDEEEEEEKRRKSLEVFGNFEKTKKKIPNLEKKLTLLSWDDMEIEGGGDNESDASSDLFEIESLTGKAANLFLARQGSGNTITSGCITPTCYAPSEVSIEWSVVTASAADLSFMSDCEEIRPSSSSSSPVISNAKTKNNNITEISKRRPSILLGCKSQKAVNVAGDAHITNDHHHQQKVNNNHEFRVRYMPDNTNTTNNNSFTPMSTRFGAENKLMNFRQRAAATTRSHLPRANNSSHLLYIQ